MIVSKVAFILLKGNNVLATAANGLWMRFFVVCFLCAAGHFCAHEFCCGVDTNLDMLNCACKMTVHEPFCNMQNENSLIKKIHFAATQLQIIQLSLCVNRNFYERGLTIRFPREIYELIRTYFEIEDYQTTQQYMYECLLKNIKPSPCIFKDYDGVSNRYGIMSGFELYALKNGQVQLTYSKQLLDVCEKTIAQFLKDLQTETPCKRFLPACFNTAWDYNQLSQKEQTIVHFCIQLKNEELQSRPHILKSNIIRGLGIDIVRKDRIAKQFFDIAQEKCMQDFKWFEEAKLISDI